MTVGLLAAPVAYKNYLRKKAAYEQEVARYKNMLEQYGSTYKAAEWYNRQKELLSDIRMGRDEDGDVLAGHPDWIDVKYKMFVGNLGGKNISMDSYLKVTNNSDEDVTFGAVYVDPFLYGESLLSISDGDVIGYGGYYGGDYTIRAGRTNRYEFDTGIAKFLTRSLVDRLRNDLALKGIVKGDFNSVPGGTILYDVLTAYVLLERYYKDEKGNTIRTQMQWHDVKCELEYVGKAWIPGINSAWYNFD